jgi:hypothetical protein
MLAPMRPTPTMPMRGDEEIFIAIAPMVGREIVSLRVLPVKFVLETKTDAVPACARMHSYFEGSTFAAWDGRALQHGD